MDFCSQNQCNSWNFKNNIYILWLYSVYLVSHCNVNLRILMNCSYLWMAVYGVLSQQALQHFQYYLKIIIIIFDITMAFMTILPTPISCYLLKEQLHTWVSPILFGTQNLKEIAPYGRCRRRALYFLNRVAQRIMTTQVDPCTTFRPHCINFIITCYK